MGQRLNIEITDCGNTLANCYYHWSAYTDSAMELTMQIIQEFQDSVMPVDIETAVRLLEATGGGVDDCERKEIEKEPERFGHIKFRDATNRNEGLIAVTDVGIENTRQWEEGRVIIDLSSETVCFDVLWYTDREEYRREYVGEYENWSFKDLQECRFNPDSIPFEDFSSFIDFINEFDDGVRYGDYVIQWIR